MGAGEVERTYLEPMGDQSVYASAMLDAFEKLVLTGEYEERLRRHYRLVKDALLERQHPIHRVIRDLASASEPEAARQADEEIRQPIRRGVTVARNDPCPCGSGKKFKRCCLETGLASSPPSTGLAPSPPALEKRQQRQNYWQKSGLDEWFLGRACTPALAQVEVEAYLSGSPHAPFPLHPHVAARLAEDAHAPFDERVLKLVREHLKTGWTFSRVAGMSLDSIGDQLRAFGVPYSRELFVSQASGSWSAFGLAGNWIENEPVICRRRAQLFFGIAAHELWRRLLPERPSMEMLDDQMQDGYRLIREGRDQAAADTWWKLWRVATPRIPGAIRATEDVTEVFSGLQLFSNWIGTFQDLLLELQYEGQPVAGWGIEFGLERIRRFPDDSENCQVSSRRAVASHMLALGHLREGRKMLETILTAWPRSAWGYVALADELAHFWPFSRALPRDLDGARRALELGLKKISPDDPDREVLLERLEALSG
ncbi:MAG: SEC-C domain-containing protein [Candidatus Wallbacteria bacterium]|nr:SEC-C domain-containing protein [Candidatus Wallbacteria bacterium]